MALRVNDPRVVQSLLLLDHARLAHGHHGIAGDILHYNAVGSDKNVADDLRTGSEIDNIAKDRASGGRAVVQRVRPDGRLM